MERGLPLGAAMLRFLFVAFALLVTLAAGCAPRCRQPDFSRGATVTSEYLLVTGSAEGRREERGIGPNAVTMSGFDAFRCSEYRADLPVFWVELGPDCKLPVTATSHRRDTGRWSSFAFIQAEGKLVAGRECTLSLDGGRTIGGTVDAGVMVIRPSTMNVDVALKVPDGTLRLTASGSWDGA